MSVGVFSSPNGFWHLVISPHNQNAYIISIDPETGTPFFSGLNNIDLFSNYQDATVYLQKKFLSEFRYHGIALIGLTKYENITIIALIDQIEEVGTLPGGHSIKKVKHVNFINIQHHITTTDNNIKTPFEDFQINDNHFYCESFDLSRPFPSQHQPTEANADFLWNSSFIQPFSIIGIKNCCVHLMEGVCSTFYHSDFKLTLITRRSVSNPGTRYLARGLNSKNSPANECECDIIFEKGNQYWCVSWCRGSPPIRWQTILNTKLSSPVHKVSSDFSQGTAEYFGQLRSKYNNAEIHCISFLQAGANHSEKEVADSYKIAADELEKNNRGVHFHAYDLNHQLSHLPNSAAVLYDFISFLSFIEPDDYTHGYIPTNTTSNEINSELTFETKDKSMREINEMLSNTAKKYQQKQSIQKNDEKYQSNEVRIMVPDRKQKKICRFNCADSLDRTNLGTFYYCLWIVNEWCLNMDTGIGDLTEERDFEEIDFSKPDTIINKDLLAFLVKTFVNCGNVISYLYTNTPAIKVENIRFFAPDAVESQSSDSYLSVQRRLENIINDPEREKIIQYWIKKPQFDFKIHFPTDHIFAICDNTDRSSKLLLTSKADLYPVPKNDQLLLCLPIDIILNSIYFFVAPLKNTETQTTPIKVKIEVGSSLNTKQIAKFRLPQVSQPTWCKFTINDKSLWNSSSKSTIYIRFIRLIYIFDNSQKEKVTGNIQIEGSLEYGREDTIFEFQSSDSSDYLNEFTNEFQQFLNSDRSFIDVLKLEQSRLILGISEKVRQNFAIKANINPWTCDPSAQIKVAESERNKCVQCGTLFNDSNPPHFFVRSTFLKTLIASPQKPISNECDDDKFIRCCSNCLSELNLFAFSSQELEGKGKSYTAFPLPYFTNTIIPNVEKRDSIISMASAIFTKIPPVIDENSGINLLLSKEGGLIELPKGKHSFQLLFCQKISPNSIEIKSEMGSFKLYVEGKEIQNNHSLEEFGNQKQFLNFDIEVISEKLILHKINIYGTLPELEIKESNLNTAGNQNTLDKLNQESKIKLEYNYDDKNRIGIYKVPEKIKEIGVSIKKIEIKVVSSVKQMIFIFAKNEQSKRINISIPTVVKNTLLYYPLPEVLNVNFVKVFYVDEISSCEPQLISFIN